MTISEAKEEEQKEGGSLSVLPFQGRRRTKKLTVTDDLRKKFQEGNKRKQNLLVRIKEKEVKLTGKFYSSKKTGIL